jgi:hypothetical protein
VAGRLIVERLDDETLVYDTERNEAHALAGESAAEFLVAEDDVSRREVLRKLALAGAAAAGTGVLVKTIVAPTAAQAQSAVCNPACAPGNFCCQPTANTCCSAGASVCCFPGSATTCCSLAAPACCAAGSTNSCVAIPFGGCTANAQCCSNVCCNGTCCPQGQSCVAGVCAALASDCNLKHHLGSVDPQHLLAALGFVAAGSRQ